MKKFLHNLVHRPNGDKVAAPVLLFWFITFGFGLAFVSPPGFFGVVFLPLFQFSASTSHALPFIWGIFMLLTTALNLYMLGYNQPKLNGVVGLLGFCCWLYALIAYLLIGFLFGLLFIALPNMIFWGWYSHNEKRYAARE